MIAKSVRITLPAAVLLVVSCATKDENTLVGSGFIDERRWAVPVADDSTTGIPEDTYFEALASRPGERDDLLVGTRRKFRFEAALFFDDLPAEGESLVAARLIGEAWAADGTGRVRVGRATSDWREETARETLSVDETVETTAGGSLDVEIPLDWVRGWIDADSLNHGLLLGVVETEGDEFFLRFPSREAETDSTGGAGAAFRLEVTYADTARGADSVRAARAALDRYDGFEIDATPYVTEYAPSDTVLTGMWESLVHNGLFRLALPDEWSGVSINRAELVLTVASAALEEEALALAAYAVQNDSFETDSIAFAGASIGELTVPFDAAPSDTVALDLTGAVAGWLSGGEMGPRLMIAPRSEDARDRFVRWFSTDYDGPPLGGTAAGRLRPRLRVLYTPPRPSAEETE